MAKVKGPLSSLKASGQFARAIIYSHLGPTQYVTKLHRPKAGATIEQQEQRDFFKAGKIAWGALTTEQQEAYTERAGVLGLTGYNLFLREYLVVPTTPEEIDDMELLGAQLEFTTITQGYADPQDCPVVTGLDLAIGDQLLLQFILKHAAGTSSGYDIPGIKVGSIFLLDPGNEDIEFIRDDFALFTTIDVRVTVGHTYLTTLATAAYMARYSNRYHSESNDFIELSSNITDWSSMRLSCYNYDDDNSFEVGGFRIYRYKNPS